MREGFAKTDLIEYSSERITDQFGLRISNVNLKSINQKTGKHFRELLYKNKLLIFKNVDLTPDEYLKFSRYLGEPVKFVDIEYHHPDFPEIFVVSNVQKNGKKFGMDRVGYYWHSDSSFMPEPLPITMLYSQIVPNSGGETAFIDMANAYNNLEPNLSANLSKLYASHEGKWRYLIINSDVGLSIEEILDRDEKLVPSQIHPLVIKHPETGCKALYLSQGITRRIIGMPEIEGRELLSRIWKDIENSSAKYKHQWKAGELVIWDNRSVVHRAYPSKSGQSRLMFRIGIRDNEFFGKL